MSKLKIYIASVMLLLIIPLTARAEAGAEMKDDTTAIPLKVMTLNIHSGINWYGSFDPDGLTSLIREIDPDIVGLQEVDRNWSSKSGFRDLPAELAQRLNMFYAFSASLERNNGYFGNLILSKYPIIQVWTSPLPGSLEPRSFALVQVLVEGVRVNFLTTHLGLSVSDRLQQAAKIIEFTNLLSGPLIVTGDFNGDAGDPAVAGLERNFLNFQGIGEIKDQGTFRSKDGIVSSKMDYILVTPEFGLTKIEVADTFVSDHLPVIAELTLEVERTAIAGNTIVIQPGYF